MHARQLASRSPPSGRASINPPLIGGSEIPDIPVFVLELTGAPQNTSFMDKTTAVYMRVSTQGQSTRSQRGELQKYCQMRGWRDLRFYEEKMSGAATSRPELDRMVQDMRAGSIERLVCYKLDRLGRSLTHLALILDEMNRLRIPLICSSQGIDTSDDSPCGKFQLAVLMAVAEFERGIIRERVRSGLAAAKARGVKLGRPATLMHRVNDVMALKAKGLGVCAISRELKMPLSSVHKILSVAA